jgi:hypothetical protein
MMQVVIYDDIAIRPICEYLIKEDTNNIEMGDMKMKKKVLSILVSLTIAVSLLAACGGSDPETSTTSSPIKRQQQAKPPILPNLHLVRYCFGIYPVVGTGTCGRRVPRSNG